MSALKYASVNVGDALPALTLPAVNRTMLAIFAGASGDLNPVHIDIDFARKAGMSDVFAHGMLGMAWLGRLLTQWSPQAQLRDGDGRRSAGPSLPAPGFLDAQRARRSRLAARACSARPGRARRGPLPRRPALTPRPRAASRPKVDLPNTGGTCMVCS